MNHRCLKWGKEGELSRGLSETSSSASEHYDDSILKTNGVNSQLTLPKLVLNADRQSPKPFKCQNKKILWQPPIRFPVSITAWRKTRFRQLFLLCWITVTCILWKLGVFWWVAVAQDIELMVWFLYPCTEVSLNVILMQVNPWVWM